MSLGPCHDYNELDNFQNFENRLLNKFDSFLSNVLMYDFKLEKKTMKLQIKRIELINNFPKANGESHEIDDFCVVFLENTDLDNTKEILGGKIELWISVDLAKKYKIGDFLEVGLDSI